MKALASPLENAYLQRYPLRDNLKGPAAAPVATPLAAPGPPPEAPPPAGTTRDISMEPSPQDISPAPGPSGPDDDLLTSSVESPTSQPADTTDGDDGDGGPGTGLVVGSVVAIIAALFICVAVAIYVIARRRRLHRAKSVDPPEPVCACRRCHTRACLAFRGRHVSMHQLTARALLISCSNLPCCAVSVHACFTAPWSCAV